jgi:DNA-binding response OmpR family regulator
MRILVVEDDAEAATAMVRGLTEAGHEPTHAVDGAFGLLEAQKGGYDVYVVDRMMPCPPSARSRIESRASRPARMTIWSNPMPSPN